MSVLFSRFKFKCSFLFKSAWVAHHLTTTGGNKVTTSYWVENLHLSFGIWMMPEWYVEMDRKNFEKDRKMTEKYLWKSKIFRNVTGCNNYSNDSLYKKANSSRKYEIFLKPQYKCEEVPRSSISIHSFSFSVNPCFFRISQPPG